MCFFNPYISSHTFKVGIWKVKELVGVKKNDRNGKTDLST